MLFEADGDGDFDGVAFGFRFRFGSSGEGAVASGVVAAGAAPTFSDASVPLSRSGPKAMTSDAASPATATAATDMRAVRRFGRREERWERAATVKSFGSVRGSCVVLCVVRIRKGVVQEHR
nr:hypothetical protein [Streptomyces sp. LBUM 1483]